jgi:predicted DNA-binding helix-hairpin-helix protein
MDRRAKMALLARAAQYDLCGCARIVPRGRPDSATGQALTWPRAGMEVSRVRDVLGRWLYPAALPNGRRVALLKVLQSNLCENDCFYCANRRSRETHRCEFGPEELAAAFDDLVRRRRAEGLFLSSAVCRSTARTMQQMIATVELVRFKYHFSGYVHLKLLPGCEQAAVERAVQIADRVSVNLEAPSAERLRRLSADKVFERDLLQPMRWAKQFRDQDMGAGASLTTQFVVGAAGESDHEILVRVERLRHEMDLTRVYFSAFRPISDTPLENLPGTPLIRQHRLYQSDYLFRHYGFAVRDLIFDDSGNLCTDMDPKMAWAMEHPEVFPIEVNRAGRQLLLRVPGIGPRSAARILHMRRRDKLRHMGDLRAVGAVASRAAPFILLDGQRTPQQLSLC